MTDRRRMRSSGRILDGAPKGQVQTSLSTPQPSRVFSTVCDLCSEPEGSRDRQLLRGEVFVVLEVHNLWLFGYAERDGYAGWIDAKHLVGAPKNPATHSIAVVRSYGKSTPGLKSMGHITPLSFGAQLTVLSETDGWSKVAWSRGTFPKDIYVPSKHLSWIGEVADDPLDIATRFLGTPYLWGGNSAFGLDCSALVQAACLACGIPCPGDSDMQEAELGTHLPEDAPLQRGDLLFWKGHVAWVADPDTLIHANAFHMATAYEPLQDAIKRIEAQGDGPVTARKRLGEIT